MSVARRIRSPAKPIPEPPPRAILGPGGNRVRVSEDTKRKQEVPKEKKPLRQEREKQSRLPPPRATVEVLSSAVKGNSSVDSSCTSLSDTCSNSSGGGSSSGKVEGSRSITKINGTITVKVIPHVEALTRQDGPVKRCDWITPNSDPVYTSFHDEEWGVPVHDDRKLFELLVLSQALAELSWPAILHARDVFRKLFDKFDPSSIAQFTEKKLLSLKVDGNLLLSEPKLRAILENAKQLLKLQQEFGSFSNYCWRFVNHKPLKNGFRYTRQVPVKSPKAELISKDLMQRGFRCVGPTVVYSFMQVAGIVNDHIVTCFRYEECNAHVLRHVELKPEQSEVVTI